MTISAHSGNFDDRLLMATLDQHQEWVATHGKRGRKADLRGQDLRGTAVDLSRYCLKDAMLENAILANMNLSGCQLNGAFLVKADLKGANLRHADLSGAYLIETDLRSADLRFAELQRTDLTGAKVRGALWEECVFQDTIIDNSTLLELPDEVVERADGLIFAKSGTTIIRKLRPRKDAYDASVGILGFLAKALVRAGYSDEDVKVSIQPLGEDVILSIQAPLEKKTPLEDHLERFFDVLGGKIKAEDEYGEELARVLGRLVAFAMGSRQPPSSPAVVDASVVPLLSPVRSEVAPATNLPKTFRVVESERLVVLDGCPLVLGVSQFALVYTLATEFPSDGTPARFRHVMPRVLATLNRFEQKHPEWFSERTYDLVRRMACNCATGTGTKTNTGPLSQLLHDLRKNLKQMSDQKKDGHEAASLLLATLPRGARRAAAASLRAGSCNLSIPTSCILP